MKVPSLLATALLQLLAGGADAGSIPEQGSTWKNQLIPMTLKSSLNLNINLSFHRVAPLTGPSPDKRTSHVSRLRGIPRRGPANNLAHSSLYKAHKHLISTFDLKVAPNRQQNSSSLGEYQLQYAIECKWDSHPVWLILDTGSSDTWASSKDYVCHDSTGKKIDQQNCAMGKTDIQGFKHGEVDQVHFRIEYGDGEKASGPMGLSDLSCGGISVKKQQVGLANATYWHGNNITSGLLGLAYPCLTGGYFGAFGEEKPWTSAPYTPFFSKAISQGDMAPLFTVALSRKSDHGGLLAWGGMPPELEYDKESMVATPLIITSIPHVEESAWEYSFYTIIPDGAKWGAKTDWTRYPYIVDTGTTMNYFPPPLAEAIAAAFNPPATYLYQYGAYFVPCDSVPPNFGIIIEGRTFYLNPSDLIYADMVDPTSGFCAVALTTGGNGPYILGDAFMQSVVAVFDVGGAEMRFYSRYYSNEDD